MDAAGLGSPDPDPEAEMNRTLVFVETKKGADQVRCRVQGYGGSYDGTMGVVTVVVTDVTNATPRSWTSTSTGRASPSPASTGTAPKRRGRRRYAGHS